MQPVDADLDLAITLARSAARAIIAVKSTARATSTQKADDSPVTAADLAADAIIRAGLASTGDVVVTEESWGDQPLPATGRVWIVDPLDGTSDFVAGRDDYVVQIALVVDGTPRLGVVVQPETGTLWWGRVNGEGVAHHCECIDVDGAHVRSLSAKTLLPARPRVCVSVSHPSVVVDAIAADLGVDTLGIGSVGLKIGAIVDGRADAYLTGSRHIKVWDTAAPWAVCVAAGGVMTSLSGRPLRYDGPIVHDDGVAALAPAALSWRPRLDEALLRFKTRASGSTSST